MTLFPFGDGESISEECYFGDTLYYILEGRFMSLWGRTAAVFKRAIAWQFPPIPPRSSCSGWLQAAADHAFIMI